jgi:hypothetical protein
MKDSDVLKLLKILKNQVNSINENIKLIESQIINEHKQTQGIKKQISGNKPLKTRKLTNEQKKDGNVKTLNVNGVSIDVDVSDFLNESKTSTNEPVNIKDEYDFDFDRIKKILEKTK